MKNWVLIPALFMCFLSAHAQKDSTKVKFDLEVRERFESWNGMNAKNYGNSAPGAIGKLDDNMDLQRIVTGVTITPSSNWEMGAHIQDSRAFGWSLRNALYPNLFKVHAPGKLFPSYTMNPNEAFFQIYDAYLEYKHLFHYLTVKAGRQKIAFGDYHLFGSGEWGNTGRWTWDAVNLDYQRGENFIDLFGGGTIIHDPTYTSLPFVNTEFWGGGLYAHYHWKKVMNIEPFYALKTQGSAPYIRDEHFDRNWLGVRAFNNDLVHMVFDVTYVREFGSEEGKPIDVYGYFAKLGYQFFFVPFKPILTFRESYASGGNSAEGTVHTFDPAYGAGDKYYGWMNITSWTNLDDREVVIEWFPVRGLWIETKYNRFYMPESNVTLLNTMKLIPGDHYFGNEFDIFARYQVAKHWQITGLFGVFHPGNLQPIDGETPKNATTLALQVLFQL
ncbi:MAG: alginate export family protein [Microbacter sp.]